MFDQQTVDNFVEEYCHLLSHSLSMLFPGSSIWLLVTRPQSDMESEPIIIHSYIQIGEHLYDITGKYKLNETQPAIQFWKETYYEYRDGHYTLSIVKASGNLLTKYHSILNEYDDADKEYVASFIPVYREVMSL